MQKEKNGVKTTNQSSICEENIKRICKFYENFS